MQQAIKITTPRKSENWMEEGHQRFQALYAQWLAARARQQEAPSEVVDVDHDAIARELMFTPVFKDWMLVQKMEVYEYYLVGSSGDVPDWTDKRTVAWFGAIKADVLNIIED